MNPDLGFLFILVLAVGVYATAHGIYQNFRRRDVREMLRDKPVVMPEDYGTVYFPGDADRAEIATKLVRLLLKEGLTDIRKLTPDDNLHQVRMFDYDSMAAVAFVIGIEETFSIKVPDGEFADLLTLRDFVEMILRKRNESSAASTAPAP